MPQQQLLQENWKIFADLVNQLETIKDNGQIQLVKRYLKQNLIFLNEIFLSNINSLKKLQSTASAHDVLKIQAGFTNEVSKMLALSTERFINTSLVHISDYNEWLNAHCNLATD